MQKLQNNLHSIYTKLFRIRSIQVFMFSLLMPMFEKINLEFIGYKQLNINPKIKNYLPLICSVVIALLIPLVFNTSNAFYFYHSIYCDVVTGVLFFWCIFDVYKEHNDLKYMVISLTIGLSILVLSKMTAISLIPLVFIFGIMLILTSSKYNKKIKKYIILFVPFIIPVLLWIAFNAYVDHFVENTGGAQSYDGMSLSSVIEVFFKGNNSSISYLPEVKKAFFDALFNRNLLIHGSYVLVLSLIVIAFFFLSNLCKDNNKKIIISGILVVFSSFYYAMLMYFLYSTAFSEYEAVNLASYERYMNSFLISIIYFLLAICYDVKLWEKNKKILFCCISLFIFLFIFQNDSFDQVLPGYFSGDLKKTEKYISSSKLITELAGESETVFIIKRGDDGDFIWHQRYYCSPRTIDGGSIGPTVNDGDIWSTDLSVQEFANTISKYDYLYLYKLDEDFISKYSEAFSEPELLFDGSIYAIAKKDNRIILEKANEK